MFVNVTVGGVSTGFIKGNPYRSFPIQVGFSTAEGMVEIFASGNQIWVCQNIKLTVSGEEYSAE